MDDWSVLCIRLCRTSGISSIDDDVEVDAGGGSGAALVYPLEAGQVKKGAHAMLKGFPCKVVDYSTSKTGKHGHAKAKITGLDIFTGKKYQELCPSTHNMNIPFVNRTEWTCTYIDEEGFAQLMNDQGDTREDLIINNETPWNKLGMADEIQEAIDGDKEVTVVVVTSMEQSQIQDFKAKDS